MIKWETNMYCRTAVLPKVNIPHEQISVGISTVPDKHEQIYLHVSKGTENSVSLRHLTPEAARDVAQMLIDVANKYERDCSRRIL